MTKDELKELVDKVSPPTVPITYGDWVFLASVNENLLDKELKLAGDRIGWMMTSQSILFGAFCLLLLNKEKNPIPSKLLLDVIPFVALAIVVGGLLGFIAAQIVIHRLEAQRSFYQATLSKLFDIKIPDIGKFRDGWWLGMTRFLGYIPSVVITLLLLTLWLVLLLSRLNVAIKIGDFGGITP